MKAYVKHRYGGPEILQLSEVDNPKVPDDHLLIEIKANSVNPADWHVLRGEPKLARLSFGLFKPKNPLFGSDFSGVVVEKGQSVDHFKVGDHVFGETLDGGAFAEYASVPAKVCGKMPEGADFTQFAALPIAGLTALQALSTHGKLQQGEKVLINGASGGVGHLAVQIAKALGGEVTAVCSSRNREFVTSLGADQVLAYDEEAIHEHTGQYDLVLDVHGNLRHKDFTRLGQRGIMIGFTTMGNMLSVVAKKLFSSFPLKIFTAQANTADLEKLADMTAAGKLHVNIDKRYSYQQIPEAIAYIEKMHTRGKVVMVWRE